MELEEFKNLLISISQLLGFSYSWNDNLDFCENIYRFFEQLNQFLGGKK